MQRGPKVAVQIRYTCAACILYLHHLLRHLAFLPRFWVSQRMVKRALPGRCVHPGLPSYHSLTRHSHNSDILQKGRARCSADSSADSLLDVLSRSDVAQRALPVGASCCFIFTPNRLWSHPSIGRRHIDLYLGHKNQHNAGFRLHHQSLLLHARDYLVRAQAPWDAQIDAAGSRLARRSRRIVPTWRRSSSVRDQGPIGL